MLTKEMFIANPDKQRAIGACLARACDDRGAMIYLQGDLGAGKTTLVRGFLQGLGYTGKVKSPTYTLVEPYELAMRLVLHIDLYRLQHVDEVQALGIIDQLVENSLCLIEWPDKAENQLPSPDLTCYIAPFDQGRQLRFVAETFRGKDLLTAMLNSWGD